MRQETGWEEQLGTRNRLLALGVTISAARKIKGLSQEQLAEEAGISRSYLSMIEAPNIAQTFSLDVLYHLADALEMRSGDLLNGQISGGITQDRPPQ